ncbi:MAG: HlyD family secretion protein, partial [Anaerolineae bacterium]
MKRTARIVIGAFLAMLVFAAGIYFWRSPAARVAVSIRLGLATPPASGPYIFASGSIEATLVGITSEVGGRVAAIYADEGDEVQQGQVVMELDTALMDAEIRKAEAAVALAQAGVELAGAPPSPELIAKAEAYQQQAELAAQAAYQAWQDAQAVLRAPREIDVELAGARTKSAAAEIQVQIAGILAQAADLEQALYERLVKSLEGGVEVVMPGPGGPTPVKVPAPPQTLEQAREQWNLASQRTWQAYAALEEARRAHNAALHTLADVQRRRENPLALEAQVHAAEANYQQALAAVEAARRAVEDLKAGPRPEDLAVAQAELAKAQAALRLLQTQREKMILRAPAAGLVTERSVGLGEVIAPNARLLRIANLDQVTLTVYVPEPQIGRVKIGQRVWVEVDAYPGRLFEVRLSLIADEAEFTHKIVQT